MTDLTLFELEPPLWAQDEIGRKWWAVHQAQPAIGREFVRLAREWRQHNPTSRVGSKAILEVLRWNTQVGVVPHEGEPYRINSNWSALYARWAMSTYPDLEGAFEVRERKSEFLAR